MFLVVTLGTRMTHHFIQIGGLYKTILYAGERAYRANHPPHETEPFDPLAVCITVFSPSDGSWLKRLLFGRSLFELFSWPSEMSLRDLKGDLSQLVVREKTWIGPDLSIDIDSHF
jgi:hypothetical protein